MFSILVWRATGD